MQVPQKIRGLAMAYFVYAVVGMIGFAGLGAIDFLAHMLEQNNPELASDAALLNLFTIAKGLIIFMTILHVAVNVLMGWALQNGRLYQAVNIIALIMLVSFPVGTVLGIISLKWLREPQVEQAFTS